MEVYLGASAIVAIVFLIAYLFLRNASRWHLKRRARNIRLFMLMLIACIAVLLRLHFMHPPPDPARLFATTKDWTCARLGLTQSFCAPTVRACDPRRPGACG